MIRHEGTQETTQSEVISNRFHLNHSHTLRQTLARLGAALQPSLKDTVSKSLALAMLATH